jgi:hypothetical protein
MGKWPVEEVADKRTVDGEVMENLRFFKLNNCLSQSLSIGTHSGVFLEAQDTIEFQDTRVRDLDAGAWIPWG